MLDIEFIRKYPEKVKKGALAKGYDVSKILDHILKVDKERKIILLEVEKLRAARNKITNDADGKPSKTNIEKSKRIKDKLGSLDHKLKNQEIVLREYGLQIPNLPAKDVKIGEDDSKNHVIETIGKPKKFNFKVKDHIELGKELDLIDIERAAKVSGSRFYYLKNEATILEFAIVKWVLDKLTDRGFSPVIPPVIINSSSMRGMGYIESGEETETYYLEKDDQYLVATAEQSIGPMHQGEIFKEEDLPKRYVGFSPAFRREAGSYGKDTKGIIRVHQFDKLEMFSYTKPEDSDKENFFFLDLEKNLMKELGLPFQVVGIVTGDLGFPAARKIDIETWVPSQQKYRETHSTSTTTDFQARRLNIRFKRKPTPEDNNSKAEYVHTVNGTAIALGRVLVCILENYQQEDGSIKIPEVLQKYAGFKEIKRK